MTDLLWIVQDNLHREPGYDLVLETFARFSIPFVLVKVVPFSHETIPHIDAAGPKVVLGSYTLAKLAHAAGWTPGAWISRNFDYDVLLRSPWAHRLLNHDGIVTTIRDMTFKEIWNMFGEWMTWVFVRPALDSKSFAGQCMHFSDLREWQKDIEAIHGDPSNPTVTLDTKVVLAPLKPIYREVRFWIVKDSIVTASQYKRGTRVIHEPVTQGSDPRLWTFVGSLTARISVDFWSPADAYVLDVAETPDGFKIVEVQNLNSSGYYAADVQTLVLTINGAFG